MAYHAAPPKPVPALQDPSAEPKLPRGKDVMGDPFPPLHYELAFGRPVFGGVSADDVVQGTIGDCFFLSSLAALAHTHPDIVVRALDDHHDGTYTVTLRGT